MKSYTYIQPEAIEYTGQVPIMDEQGRTVSYSRRVYSHRLKKTFDRLFDYRYFLSYEAVDEDAETVLFRVKKISRRGKVWFVGWDLLANQRYMISYENWRIGIPTLFISDGQMKIQVEKEMEEWSRFLLNGETIARWQANYKEGQFHMTLVIEDNSPIQHPAFFIAISQATLFVGT